MLGDRIVRRTDVIIVVAVRRMSLVTRKVFAITRKMKTVTHSSMTAGATQSAAPIDVAHDKRVNDDESNVSNTTMNLLMVKFNPVRLMAWL